MCEIKETVNTLDPFLGRSYMSTRLRAYLGSDEQYHLRGDG